MDSRKSKTNFDFIILRNTSPRRGFGTYIKPVIFPDAAQRAYLLRPAGALNRTGNEYDNKKSEINTSKWPAGMYLIPFKTSEGVTKVRKVAVTR